MKETIYGRVKKINNEIFNYGEEGVSRGQLPILYYLVFVVLLLLYIVVFIDHQLCAETSLVLLVRLKKILKSDKATQNLSVPTINDL